MGLFERQQINNEIPIYTVGGQETFLIIGLGNVGKQYEYTRHNLGFLCLDYFAKKNGLNNWIDKKHLACQETSGIVDKNRIILAKPTTMMNDSGIAVSSIQKFYKVDDAHTLVLHDELDVDFGKIRVRKGGSDAGNNGIKSLIKYGVGDTWRLRIGIGPKSPPQIDSIKFVLGKFSKEQQIGLSDVVKGSQIIISEYIFNKTHLEPETRYFTS